MTGEQSIQCPVCQTPILIEYKALIQGMRFTCGNCKASIGIASEAISVAKETMKKYDELKTQFRDGKKVNK
ncbi:hypothetical protein SanaruYs_16630 [Chryseotalea sanaruensis]|uniref:Uncharacterized protein n=1 Tax=Chryseotalea sanaruensis TaxID=2482724 RepID=A0A401U961_9BACT|nr:hypothetical protein [Chryseotalea sanaruensis]GCC51438.1 hypothetical protein SanaruYs_16630 [Chryseotalea sanaruensis]